MKNILKKICSILTVIALIMGCFPAVVSADDVPTVNVGGSTGGTLSPDRTVTVGFRSDRGGRVQFKLSLGENSAEGVRVSLDGGGVSLDHPDESVAEFTFTHHLTGDETHILSLSANRELSFSVSTRMIKADEEEAPAEEKTEPEAPAETKAEPEAPAPEKAEQPEPEAKQESAPEEKTESAAPEKTEKTEETVKTEEPEKTEKTEKVKEPEKEEPPREETPKEEAPKEESPKEEIPEEEPAKEETPKEETPKEEMPGEETLDEVIPEEVPAEATREEQSPEEKSPEGDNPEETIPQDETPEEQIPEEKVPEETAPGEETREGETPPSLSLAKGPNPDDIPEETLNRADPDTPVNQVPIALNDIAPVTVDSIASGGEVVGPGATVQRYDEISVNFSFSIPDANLENAKAHSPWTLDLSDNFGDEKIFSALTEGQSGQLIDKSTNTEVGTYTVSTDGKVSLTPSWDWLKDKTTGVGGTFSVAAQLNETTNYDLESNTFDYPGGTDTTITFTERELTAEKCEYLKEKAVGDNTGYIGHALANKNRPSDTGNAGVQKILVQEDGSYRLFYQVQVQANCKPSSTLTVTDTLEGGQQLDVSSLEAWIPHTQSDDERITIPSDCLTAGNSGFTLDLKGALEATFTDPESYVGKNVWIRYSTIVPESALDHLQTNRAHVTFDTKDATVTTTVTPEFTPSLDSFKQIDTDEELRDPVTGQDQTMPIGSEGKLYFLTGGTLSSPANSLYVTDASTGVAIDEDSIKVAIGNSEDWQGYEAWKDLKDSGACTFTTAPDPSDSSKTVITGFSFDVHRFIKWLVEVKKTNSEGHSFSDLYKDLFYYLTPGDSNTFTLRAGTTFKLYYEGTALPGYMPGATGQGQVSNTATWHCNFKEDEHPSVSVTLTPDTGAPEIYKNEFALGNDPAAEGENLVDGTTGKLKYNIRAGTYVRYELRVLNKDLTGNPISLGGATVTDSIFNFIKAVPETIAVYDSSNTKVAEYNTGSKTWTTNQDPGFTIQVVNDGSEGGWSHPIGVTADPNVNVRDALGQSYDLFKLTFPQADAEHPYTDTYTIKYVVQTDDSTTATDALYGGHAVYNSGEVGVVGGPTDSATLQLNIDYGFPYDTVKRFLEWDKENNEAVWAVDIPLNDGLTEIIRPLNVTEKYYSAQAGVKRTDTEVSADSFSFEAYELILPGYTTGSRLTQAADAAGAARNEYIIVDSSGDPNYPQRQLVFPNGISKSVRVIVRMKLPHTLSEQLEYHAKNKVYVDVDGNTVSPEATADYVDDEFLFEKKGKFDHNESGDPVIVWTADINPSGKSLKNDIIPVFKDVLPGGLKTEGRIHINGYLGSSTNKAFMVKTGSSGMTGAFSLNLIDEVVAHWNDADTVKGVSEPPEGLSGWHFRIDYTTKFDADTYAAIQAAEAAGSLQDFSFKNKAEVWEDGGSAPLKEDDDTVKYLYQDLVSKEDVSNVVGGTIQVLSYSIVINEHHRKINGGRWVTLTDAIPANMDLMLSSVKVTDTAGEEMATATVSYTESTRRLQVSVPDETTAVVTFDATPTGGNTAYVNTVVLSGSDFSQTDTVEVDHKVNSAGTLVGMSNAVQIKKVDKYDISTTLPGAKFSFYECSVADDGEILGETLAGQYVSDSKGMITFSPVKGETLYYWQETEAPEDYIIASSVPHYFVVYQELAGTGKVTIPWNKLSSATRAKLKEKFTAYPLIQGLSDSSTAPVYIAAVGPTEAQAAEYNTNQYCWLTADEYPSGTRYSSLADEVNALNRAAADALNSKVTAFYSGQKSVSSVVSGYAWQVENIRSNVTTVKLQASKTLNGRAAIANEFTFQLYNDTVADDSYLEQTQTSAAAADGTAQLISFDDLSIVTAGTYKYRIVELPGSAANTTYDPAVYQITVVAEYDETEGSATYGELVANITGITKTVGTDKTTVTDLTSPVPFVNTYTQPSGTLTLTGTKTLTGRSMSKGEFRFTVKEGDTVVATGSNAAAKDGEPGAITFAPAFTYTGTGDHTYTVTEDDLTDQDGQPIPNVSQTGTTSFTVTVRVEESGSDLAASVVSVNGDPSGTVAFTNKYEIPTVELSGKKVWTDGVTRINDRVITLELYRVSETHPAAELYTLSPVRWTGDTYKYENLPKLDDQGKPYTYYVTEKEVAASAGSFTTSYQNTAASGHASETDKAYDGGTITNKPDVTYLTLSGKKVWADGVTRDNAGVITLELYRVSETYPTPELCTFSSVQWAGNTYKYEDLPELDDQDKPYTYYVIEKEVAASAGSFTTAYKNTDASGYAALTDKAYNGGTITNTPDITPLTLSGTKTLTGRAMDNEEFHFTVKEGETIVATGSSAAAADGVPGAITFTPISYTQVGDHTYTVTEDPLKDKDGNDIPFVSQAGTTSFTVKVTVEVISGRFAARVVSVNNDAGGAIAFTNEYVRPTTELTGTKVWADDVTRDNANVITLELYRVSEAYPTPELFTLNPVQWAGNTYKYEDLPELDDTDQPYTYYVIEKEVAASAGPFITAYANTDASGFAAEADKAYNGGTITNTPRTVSAAVKKVWNDDSNRDGLRPLSIPVSLKQNGKVIFTETLSAENNWFCMKTGLRAADTDGADYTYEWVETGTTDGYTAASKTDGFLTVLTNTHLPEETEIKVTKVWADNNNEAKARPASIRVQLFADGLAADEPVTLTDGSLTASWTGLPRYTREGSTSREIVYTVAELSVPAGYTARLSGSASAGFVITNTYASGRLALEKTFDLPETEEEEETEEPDTVIEVVKIWEDFDNRDGSRPDSITVHLFAGGEEVRTAVLTAADGWKKSFGGLPKFVNGHPIHYSVTEDPVEGYVSEIRGFTIRNRYVPQTVTVSVRKVWNDNGNRLGLRPQSIGMVLSNGTAVLLNEENGWIAVITDLPAMVNGEPAVYTWTEQSVIGYELESVVTEDNVTVFTNRPLKLPDKPDRGRKPQVPGEPFIVIENYDTPLGMDLVINHVGDCFD